MAKNISGQCMCGAVAFSVLDDFKKFYQCHCKQCQQLSGSAYVSNLFTDPENIAWTRGEGNVGRYEHASRSFTNAFCKVCGSSLPVITKNGNSLIVPAGALMEPATIEVTSEIFCNERAWWSSSASEAKKCDAFPE